MSALTFLLTILAEITLTFVFLVAKTNVWAEYHYINTLSNYFYMCNQPS